MQHFMKYYEKVLKTFLERNRTIQYKFLKPSKNFTNGYKERFPVSLPQILRKGFKKISWKDVFMKLQKMQKNISETLPKYFPKGYKETI